MKRFTTTLLTLIICFSLNGMERDNTSSPVPLASSPNDGFLKRLGRLVTNSSDNIWGHGEGYISWLKEQQDSFRADDMKLRDFLEATHRGEWGIYEFLKDKNAEKLREAIELTEKHKVPLNPRVIMAAQQFLRQGTPGPNFINAFKGKKIGDIGTNDQTECIHLAERAIGQFIEESNPEQLHEVLKLTGKHSLEINPYVKTRALTFFNTYQTQQQKLLMEALINIQLAETFKQTFNNTQLSESASSPFEYETFTEQTTSAMQEIYDDEDSDNEEED